jgi:hypothetical protein
MNTRHALLSTLDALDESELEEVTKFVSFLKFRRRVQTSIKNLTEEKLASLYANAKDEDRALAESGMADYQAALLKEDLAK